MSNKSMSDHDALGMLTPRSRRDRQSLTKLGAVVVAAILLVGIFAYLKQIDRQRRDRDWLSATATIEDARPKVVIQGFSQGSGAMLYQVEILARYVVDGTPRVRWITVAQTPTLRADAELKSMRWKGSTCIVRWKPSDPSKIIAEAS